MNTEIEKLAELAKLWGGELREISVEEYDTLEEKEWGRPYRERDFHDAPFSSLRLGIFWKEKVVVYAGDVFWPEVIHEMGHVFASQGDVQSANEFDFFGWEYAVAEHIGADVGTWRLSNKDYVIGETAVTNRDGEWAFGDLSPKIQDKVIAMQMERARNIGLLKDNCPQAIR